MARTADDVACPAEGEVLESRDPATQEVVGRVPVTGTDRVAAVAEEVARVHRGWALAPLQERLRVLARAADDLMERADEVALRLTRETGKTVVESHLTEVGPTASKLSWAVRYGHRYLAPERIPHPHLVIKHKRHWLVYRPLGVVGVIGPWNYPFSLAAVPTAFPLAAGNGVVLKPSELSPVSGELLAEILVRAGRAVAGILAGARVECGGEVAVPGLRCSFFTPIVLTGVDHSMRVMREETFGPILPVMPFDTEEEAVRLATDTEFGLGASVWTRDVARARRIAERLVVWMAWINDHAYSHGFGQLPWGGIKGSGTGPVASRFGFYEVVDNQLIGEDRGRIPVGWWYPYGRSQARGVLAGIGFQAHSTLHRRLGALWAGRRDLAALIRSRLR